MKNKLPQEHRHTHLNSHTLQHAPNRLLSLVIWLSVLSLSVFGSPGDLDTTFNATGIATTDVTSSAEDEANAVAIQSDGKIVVAGHSLNRFEFCLARYTVSGSLDTTFGTNGIARTAFTFGAEITSMDYRRTER